MDALTPIFDARLAGVLVVLVCALGALAWAALVEAPICDWCERRTLAPRLVARLDGGVRPVCRPCLHQLRSARRVVSAPRRAGKSRRMPR